MLPCWPVSNSADAQVLHNLSPEDSAVAAISKGLFYLDSRALAALLKELHKVGLSNR